MGIVGIVNLFLTFIIITIEPDAPNKDSEILGIISIVIGIVLAVLITGLFIYAIYRLFTKSWKFVEAWDVGGVQYVVFQSRNKKRFAVTCKEDKSEVFFKTYQDVIFFIKTKEEQGEI